MMTRKFGRTKAHREHLLTNMGRLLVRAEKLETTLPKAKEVRSIVERWITMAKRVASAEGMASLAERRRLIAIVGHDDTVTKLVDDLAKRAVTRPGGYTRILKTGHRVGDAAPKAMVLFVDRAAKPEKAAKNTATPAAKNTTAKATE